MAQEFLGPVFSVHGVVNNRVFPFKYVGQPKPRVMTYNVVGIFWTKLLLLYQSLSFSVFILISFPRQTTPDFLIPHIRLFVSCYLPVCCTSPTLVPLFFFPDICSYSRLCIHSSLKICSQEPQTTQNIQYLSLWVWVT